MQRLEQVTHPTLEFAAGANQLSMKVGTSGLANSALNAVLGFQRSPRPAAALMRSAVRQAIACMVSDGLTPPTVGNTEPSQIQRLRMSQLRQFGIDDAGSRIVAHARGAVQMAGVVVLRPDVLGVDRLQRLRHEIQANDRSGACRCRTMNK